LGYNVDLVRDRRSPGGQRQSEKMGPTVTPKKLIGLRPQEYEHPWDKGALDKLEQTPGLNTLVRKCNEWGLERVLRVQFTGSNLRVTEDNFSQLHEKVLIACQILDLPKVPDVYLCGDVEIQAAVAGVNHPLLVLSAGCIDLLRDDELTFVIGHELGHIKSGHLLYCQIAEFFPPVAEAIGSATFGLGELALGGVQIALRNWERTTEFTADRAGLLACQDPEVALAAMVKLAGLPHKYYDAINTEDFIAQARSFEALDQDKLSWLWKWLSIMGQTHPWTVMRAQQLLKWIDTGDFLRLRESDRTAAVVLSPDGPRFCTACGGVLSASVIYCSSCGILLKREH
jgi:Zn-dependent protease with chaperone function